MGLGTTHNCWHGAYSAFYRWRRKIAEVAGMPPLELMEGFFLSAEDPARNPFWRSYEADKKSGFVHGESCGAIANALEELLPLLPDEDAGGHIGFWQQKTKQFIDGLRDASNARENVEFR